MPTSHDPILASFLLALPTDVLAACLAALPAHHGSWHDVLAIFSEAELIELGVDL